MTLDEDVADRLRRLAHRQRLSFKETLNQAIRRGLAGQETTEREEPFTVKPHRGGFRPGIDPQRLNELAGQLEVDDFVRESGK